MEPFRFLPHTADAKFQAFGKTKEEAFSNSALAMTAFLVGKQTEDGWIIQVVIDV